MQPPKDLPIHVKRSSSREFLDEMDHERNEADNILTDSHFGSQSLALASASDGI